MMGKIRESFTRYRNEIHEQKEITRNRHPAKSIPGRWIFHDRSDQSEAIQIIDLLHDIRLLLLVIAVIVFIT